MVGVLVSLASVKNLTSSGRGCLIGQYIPSNASQCAQKNFLYGRGNCGIFMKINPANSFEASSDEIAGIGKNTFIAVMCIVGVCLCIIVPVAVLECRTTKKN